MLNLNVNRIEALKDKIQRGDGLVEFDAEVIVIGGGGSGAASSYQGGGGAGGFISASWIVPPKSTFDITIGSGSVPSASTSTDTTVVLASTSETYFNAKAGGGGGFAGQNGGSGGGGGLTSGSSVPSTIDSRAELAITPTGNDGGITTIAIAGGAGGGGVLSKGLDRSSGVSGGQGGDGILITNTFVNGLVDGVTEFAFGGNGASPTASGNGASAPANSGGGGNGGGVDPGDVGGSGGSGLFAIKYAGLPKASGGTITQSGGYTTHVFTGSAQFITTGKSNNNP
jgi:hypothetical protein